MHLTVVEPPPHSPSLFHRYTEAIVAVYENLAQAEEAVRYLMGKGVNPSEISVIGNTPRGKNAAEAGTQVLPHALVDAQDRRDMVLGAEVGGALGLLLGLEVFLLAGIGTVFVLGSMAVGALVVGFGGVIVSLGARHQLDAEAQYHTYLLEGKILVVVHVRDPAEAERVNIEATRPLRTEVFPSDREIRPAALPATSRDG